MAHPITRLTAGTNSKFPKLPAGGLPEVTVEEISAAAGSIPDRLRYWAVMAYVCDQHPSREEWPLLMLELQNLIVHAWTINRQPKSMKLKTVHGLAASAWQDFVDPKSRTVMQRALAAGMKPRTWEPYKTIQNRAYQDINTALHRGLRFVSAQLREKSFADP